MAAVRSAGILLFRRRQTVEVWIAHMGGPFWARKDEGAWSIPKGIVDATDVDGELAAARREFEEEIGAQAPDVPYAPLGDFALSSGKKLAVFVAEADDFDPETVTSNAFELEWPPRSGRIQSFPEIDDARWTPVDVARGKLTKGQRPLIDALLAHVAPPAPLT